MNLNDLLLSDDPDSQAIEADEEAQYEPFIDDDASVVVTEPEIITIGRGRRKHDMRLLSDKTEQL